MGIYEECLDATTTKLVENSSWANASLLTLALGQTLWIELNKNESMDSEKENAKEKCINSWFLFAFIFIFSVSSMFIPKLFCKKTDKLKEKLKDKSNELNANKCNNKQRTSTTNTSPSSEAGKLIETAFSERIESAEEKKIKKEMKILNFVE